MYIYLTAKGKKVCCDTIMIKNMSDNIIQLKKAHSCKILNKSTDIYLYIGNKLVNNSQQLNTISLHV
jgi:hypothetical protein